jgi:Chondroitin N-acetylgalactosaminyltransferase.
VRYPHDLLFFIDVDILFTAHALERIRRNTLRARQVYFPVVYSQYDPALVYSSNAAPDHYRISEEGGYWRTFGFGIAACYKTDFDKVRIPDSNGFSIVWLEDVNPLAPELFFPFDFYLLLILAWQR